MPATDPKPRPELSGKPPRPARSRFRALAERLGLLLLGTLLALLLLEGGLWGLSSFYGHRSGALPPGAGAVVLTVGDSHTYGVFYPPEESYPGHLQARLEEVSPGGYRVVNLGLPGMNSSTILAKLPRWIDRYQPRTVIFCAGINNLWNTADSDRERGRAAGARWLGRSRTLRLLRLIAFGRADQADLPEDTGRPELQRTLLDEGRGGVEHRDAATGELLARHQGNVRGGARDLDAAAHLLADDLEALLDLSREQGFEVVLLTYAARPDTPGGRFSTNDRMSETMVAFAAEHGLPVVDPRPRFEKLLGTSEDRTPFFHTQRDDHPNAAGYDEVARLVAAALLGENP